MSKLSKALIAAAGNSGGAGLTVEDVFSTYLYEGNGSTQTITNGIDLAGEGGLVWLKQRGATGQHCLYDTARGGDSSVFTSLSNAAVTGNAAYNTIFNSDGFTTNTSGGNVNGSGVTNVAWTFRKQPKFFDVVTYTGNDTSRSISHSLGSVPGCIIIKNVSSGGFDWVVYHRSSGATNFLGLNTTAAVATNATYFPSDPTSTVFNIGSGGLVNNGSDTYVAYLFAHNAGGFGLSGSDNVISCGSFTTNGSGNATVTLGYEPQWLLVKRTDLGGSTARGWYMVDSMRGMSAPPGFASYLMAQNTDSESVNNVYLNTSSTGFSATLEASGTYIYIAIRRGPMKTPTTGTQVFEPAIVSSTTPTTFVNAPFPVDLVIGNYNRSSPSNLVMDRLRGGRAGLITSSTSAEDTFSYTAYFDDMTGVNFAQGTGNTNNWWMFRRAPGFFDVVAYTGDGVAKTLNHNLKVTPKLAIAKSRNDTTSTGSVPSWWVYAESLGDTKYLRLNLTSAVGSVASDFIWGSTWSDSVFSIGTYSGINNSAGYDYIAYLFGDVAGVSKVGSYTGTGSNVNVDCGFSAGARFVLIKRTDSTGDWYVWDSARGIVSGNDPYLLLNSTAAEVTSTDYIDPLASGFTVTSSAPAALNASGGTYIYLAIA